MPTIPVQQIIEAKLLFKYGRSVRDIASELGLSARVVRRHVYGDSADTMNELPIIFAGYHIQGLEEGRKTSMRFPIEPQPKFAYQGTVKVRYEPHPFMSRAPFGFEEQMAWVAYDWVDNPVGVENPEWFLPVFGLPRTTLHVHEVAQHDMREWQEDLWTEYRRSMHDLSTATPTKTRIQITDVRMERLHDIDDAGCVADGIQTHEVQATSGKHTPALRDMAETIWNIDYRDTEFAWKHNPWVLVYDFEVLS